MLPSRFRTSWPVARVPGSSNSGLQAMSGRWSLPTATNLGIYTRNPAMHTGGDYPLPAEDVVITNENGYVLCRFAGKLELSPLVDVCRTILAACHANQQTRALIDVSKACGQLSVTDRYYHAEELSKFWDRRISLAFLCRPDQLLPDRFWEIVSRNRGLQTFMSMDMVTAREWLLADSTTERDALDHRGGP